MKEHAIAANIIELRKKKKITQEQLASVSYTHLTLPTILRV